MAIRTSKTRDVVERAEPGKVDGERLSRLKEKHLVHTVNSPVQLKTVEEMLDKGGTKMRDMMQEKSGKFADESHRRFTNKHRESVATMDQVHREKMAEKARRS